MVSTGDEKVERKNKEVVGIVVDSSEMVEETSGEGLVSDITFLFVCC